MKVLASFFALVVIITSSVCAQQPNTAAATMTIQASNGPPYPIQIFLKTALPAHFFFKGSSNQPYALFLGTIQAGAAPAWGNDIIDLDITPMPTLTVVNGFANGVHKMGPGGTHEWFIIVPNAGNPPNSVPVGSQWGMQTVVADPFSASGMKLTAATNVTIQQGPVIQIHGLGDDAVAAFSIGAMPFTFYNTSYSTAYLDNNGCVQFSNSGTPTSDFTPSTSVFNTGKARVAPMAVDLDPTASVGFIRTTFYANPGDGQLGYLRVDWVNAEGWGTAIPHNFGCLMRADGYVELIISPNNGNSGLDSVTGITPGNNIPTNTTELNFVGLQPPGSTLGAGILSFPPYAKLGAVNEKFYEWHGTSGNSQYYPSPHNYVNPYDLAGTVIHFLPSGPAATPTNRYTLY